MLDHHLRTYKDELLRPLTGCMGNIAPNTITVVAAVVGLAAAGAAAIPLHWCSGSLAGEPRPRWAGWIGGAAL